MKTLILHVGARKTGSSAIQTMLARSADRLDALGYHYIRGPRHEQAALGQTTNGNGAFLNPYLRPDKGSPDYTRHKADHTLTKMQKNKSFHTYIISSEAFTSPSLENLQEFHKQTNKAGFNLHIILYVRSIAERALSVWIQSIKHGKEVREWDDFISNHRISWGDKYRQWADHSKSIKVINYDTFRTTLFESFCKEANIPCIVDTTKTPLVNRSLTRPEIDVLRQLRKHLSDNGYDDKKIRAISMALSRHYMAGEKFGDDYKLVLTKEMRDALTRNNQHHLDTVNSVIIGDAVKICQSEDFTGITDHQMQTTSHPDLGRWVADTLSFSITNLAKISPPISA